MFTLVVFAFIVVTILLVAMYLSPRFKDAVVSKGGAVGAGLAALLALVVSWFAGSPPSLPM